MQRINIIGTSCAGKSTFANRLAMALNIPHVELDSLNWEPGWIEAPPEVFRDRILAAIAGDRWVVDGNYRTGRDIVWPIADTIVWLDYPLWLVLWRSIKRSLIRYVTRQPCCNGNQESLRRTFSRNSIILWVLKTHGSRRKNFHQLLPKLASPQAQIVVLKSPRAAERWLRNAAAGAGVNANAAASTLHTP
jgi:adenylate kinase family enzyme